MWAAKRRIPHVRHNITVGGTGPGMFVSWVLSHFPFDKNLRPRKHIAQSELFGHRTLRSGWTPGLNASAESWGTTRRIRRSSI